MGKADRRMATILTVCIVIFFAGAIGLLFSLTPFGWFLGHEGIVLSIILMLVAPLIFGISLAIGVTARSAAVSKARSGPRKRIPVKIDRVWVTDRGRVVSPHETDLKKPGFHVVLMTPEGRAIECDTAPTVIQECVEGSWGWAEVQGDWLGNYVRDPDLYTRYSGR